MFDDLFAHRLFKRDRLPQIHATVCSFQFCWTRRGRIRTNPSTGCDESQLYGVA
jgi:hypothetical protein